MRKSFGLIYIYIIYEEEEEPNRSYGQKMKKQNMFGVGKLVEWLFHWIICIICFAYSYKTNISDVLKKRAGESETFRDGRERGRGEGGRVVRERHKNIDIHNNSTIKHKNVWEYTKICKSRKFFLSANFRKSTDSAPTTRRKS